MEVAARGRVRAADVRCAPGWWSARRAAGTRRRRGPAGAAPGPRRRPARGPRPRGVLALPRAVRLRTRKTPVSSSSARSKPTVTGPTKAYRCCSAWSVTTVRARRRARPPTRQPPVVLPARARRRTRWERSSGRGPTTAARSSRLALERAGELDRLHLAAEGAREGAVDGPLDPLLEAVENSHVVPPSVLARAGGAAPAPGRSGAGTASLTAARQAVGCTADAAVLASSGARASGGIGRRARFRSVCPKGRGGSTPPSRTRAHRPRSSIRAAACRRPGSLSGVAPRSVGSLVHPGRNGVAHAFGRRGMAATGGKVRCTYCGGRGDGGALARGRPARGPLRLLRRRVRHGPPVGGRAHRVLCPGCDGRRR